LAAIVLLNPLAWFYIGWQNSKWGSVGDCVESIVEIFGSPFISFFGANKVLIGGIFYGGHIGFTQGLRYPVLLSKIALSGPNLRNILVSLAVGGLVTAAVLVTAGVFGPVVVAGVSLTALAVQASAVLAGVFGLTGLSTATVAGIAVCLASSLVYGAVYGTAKLINYCCSLQQNGVSNRYVQHFPLELSYDVSSNNNAPTPAQSQPLQVIPVAPASGPNASVVVPSGTSSGLSFMQPSSQAVTSGPANISGPGAGTLYHQYADRDLPVPQVYSDAELRYRAEQMLKTSNSPSLS